MLQAEFFGLPGLADKASAGLDADSTHGHGEGGASGHAAPAGCQYDSVYLETGFHPVKSEFNVLQQQQAATMEVIPPCCTVHAVHHAACWDEAGSCRLLYAWPAHLQHVVSVASTIVLISLVHLSMLQSYFAV